MCSPTHLVYCLASCRHSIEKAGPGESGTRLVIAVLVKLDSDLARPLQGLCVPMSEVNWEQKNHECTKPKCNDKKIIIITFG